MQNKGYKKAVYPFTENYYKQLADIAYSPLKYRENSVLLCPPLWGREHRVNQMWERKEDRNQAFGDKINQYRIQFINLINSNSESEILWMRQLAIPSSRGKNVDEVFGELKDSINETIKDEYETVYFVNIPETFDNNLLVKFFGLCQKIYYINPSKIHFILILDMKWDEDEFIGISTPFRSLFQNTKLMSLYPVREVRHFISYYSHQWKLKLHKKLIDYIVDYSGGIILLAKSALRILRNEKTKSYSTFRSTLSTHDDMKLQIEFYLQRLTERQKCILKQVANSEKVSDIEVYHMEHMGIVTKDAFGWKIKSKFIQQYLCKDSDIFIKKKQLILESDVFTRREKEILSILLSEPGIMISRAEVAKVLWGEEKSYDKYSDWAIDKTVSRIRGKIKKQFPMVEISLKSLKKIGFCLS